MSRVVLAMSGGVDSSVAAHLLCQQGCDVIGVFMRHGEAPPAGCSTSSDSDFPVLPLAEGRAAHKQGCCSAADAEDARRVADALGIPFYALNLRDEFGRIIDYFVDEYVHGRTPNPCVMCNNWLKFGKLFDYADSIGAEFVATGHYARIVGQGSPQLLRGIDREKDQSYVLFGVGRQVLSRMLFPIGNYRKSAIRDLAHRFGLDVADKRDSQEICFVSSGKHAQFVAARRGGRETSGQVVTTEGDVVATHGGIEAFTIGQRKRLGVAMGEPYYVVHIDADTNRVVIGKQPELARRDLLAHGVNWLGDRPQSPFGCEVQIRYNGQALAATVHPLEPDTVRVEFLQPCHGVAPGQAAVWYDGLRVLGGGWIAS